MKLTINYRTLLLLVVLFASVVKKTKAQTGFPAEIPSSYDVSASGAFQYSVPLRIPPGIKDMVPNLAITYNSHGGDGNLGMGWSISGLSVITRGVPTIFHDQKILPVDFNADDVYFLDGQRLFWESATSSYLTEVKNFATIKSFTTSSIDPSYFTVEYPNGTVVEYGNSTSSKMLAQGKPDVVLMWPVNKITDVHGNFINFEYTNNTSTGEYRILQIVYGQNSVPGSSGIPVTIDFGYNISRQHTNTAYVSGSEVLNNKLLSDITIEFSNLSQANRYSFYYDQSDLHPRLTNIVEERDGSTILNPINVAWGASGAPAATNSNYARGGLGLGIIAGDFNGDGYTDIAGTFSYTSTTQLNIRLNNGSAIPNLVSKTLNFVVPQVNILVTNSESQARQVVDYDGDGMDDIILIDHYDQTSADKKYRLWLLRANGNPSTIFDNPVQIHYGHNNQSKNDNFYDYLLTTIGDYDGDGKTEIIIYEPYNFVTKTEVQDYEIFIVADEYSSHQIGHYNGEHIESLMTIDVNGDGKEEIMFNEIYKVVPTTICYLNVGYNATSHKPYLIQTPTQWPLLGYGYSSNPHSQAKAWFGDFNGDGKSDMIQWSLFVGWSIAYSNGLTIEPYSSLQTVSGTSHPMAGLDFSGPTNSTGGGWGYYPGDFNGDGLCDFLELKRISNNPVIYQYKLFYSTGNGFVLSTGSLNIDAHTEVNALGDFNGDGQTDLSYQGGLLTFVGLDNSFKVFSIEHAGKTMYVQYETLPRDGDYVKMQPTDPRFLGRTLPVKVVKRINDASDLDNNYSYEGFTFHKYGLGIRGFRKFNVENKMGQKVYQTFILESAIPYLREQITFDAFGALPYGSLTSYQQLDYPGGAGGKSHIIINNPGVITDYVKGLEIQTSITLGSTSPGTVFYDFGKIESTSVRTKDLAGGNNSLQTTTYDYGANWAMLKGKPESVTIYSDIDPNGANDITRTTEYTYFANGDVQAVKTDPGTSNEKVTHYQYDYQTIGAPYGNVTQTDLSANGVGGIVTNRYTYSTDGKFLVQEENTMGYITTYNYGNPAATWGNVMNTTNHKGLQTQYTYDAVNRQTQEKDMHSGIEINTRYDWAASSPYPVPSSLAHLVVSTSNTYDGTHSATIFDKYGRILRKVSQGYTWGDVYQDYTYFPNGQVETVKGPYDSGNPTIPTPTTTYTYDAYSREIERSTDHNGATIQTSYSINNGLIHTTVSNVGAGTWKTSVSCGATLRSIISSGTPNHTIDYTYYGNGTVATTEVNSGSGTGKTFTNIVDPYGRVTDITQPNAGTISYAYDALDRVTTETRVNVAYDFTYDLLGRVTEKHEQGKPPTDKYTYLYENTNGLGKTGELIQEISPNGHFKDYDYTIEGWLRSVKEDNSFETSYAYYPNGDVEYYTFNNDVIIKYTYWYAGVPAQATLVSGNQFTSNQRLWDGWGLTPRGQRTGAYYYDVTNQPGYADRRTYDVHGLLQRHEMVNTNQGINVADNHYLFDIHTGNLAWRKDDLPGRNHTEYFTYDNHYDRLNTVSQLLWGWQNTQPLNMAYDVHGNIKEKDDVAPVLTHPWKYNDYALETVEMPGAPPFPSTVAIPQFRQDVTYTAFEKVASIREDLNNEVRFLYGADDTRVSATYTDLTGGGTGSLQKTKTYYNNYERIDYITGSKDELFYVWAGHELIAILKVFSQPSQPSVSNIYYPMRDHLGSITHLFDINWTNGAAGNGLVEERSFDAWGRTRDPNNWQPYPIGGHPMSWITDRGYTGHEHIWQPTFLNFYDNNIINMGGRLYDPLVGRMFSPDRYIPDGTNTQDYNKYIYARNNPLKYNDPDGNLVWFAPVIAGAVIGAYAGASIQSGSLNFQNWSSDSWKGAIVGGIIGAGAGAMFASAIGATGMSTGVMGTHGPIATKAWGITSTAIQAGNVNMGYNALSSQVTTGSVSVDGAWKSGVTGLLSGGFTATGGLGLVKLGMAGRLGYGAIGSAGRSIGNNWANGEDLFSKVTVAAGPVNLTLGKDQRLFRWQNNIGNIITNGIGLANLAFGGKMNVSGEHLSAVYTGGMFRDNTSAFGAHAIMGGYPHTLSLLGHEGHHIWQSRSMGDMFLPTYIFGPAMLSLLGGYYPMGDMNHFENQGYGAHWW